MLFFSCVLTSYVPLYFFTLPLNSEIVNWHPVDGRVVRPSRHGLPHPRPVQPRPVRSALKEPREAGGKRREYPGCKTADLKACECLAWPDMARWAGGVGRGGAGRGLGKGPAGEGPPLPKRGR